METSTSRKDFAQLELNGLYWLIKFDAERVIRLRRSPNNLFVGKAVLKKLRKKDESGNLDIKEITQEKAHERINRYVVKIEEQELNLITRGRYYKVKNTKKHGLVLIVSG